MEFAVKRRAAALLVAGGLIVCQSSLAYADGASEAIESIEASEASDGQEMATSRQSPAPAATAQSPHGGPWRALAIGGFVAGAAGITVGAVTGLEAIAAKREAQKGCVDGYCPPSTWSDLDRATTYSTVATVAFILGGVGVALGSVSLFLDGKSSDPSVPTLNRNASAVRVAPWVSLSGAGLEGRF